MTASLNATRALCLALCFTDVRTHFLVSILNWLTSKGSLTWPRSVRTGQINTQRSANASEERCEQAGCGQFLAERKGCVLFCVQQTQSTTSYIMLKKVGLHKRDSNDLLK